MRWERTASGGFIDWSAVGLNTLAFTAFAVHHSAFARTGVKAALARVLPERLIRSVYVWVASGLFIAVMVWWRPVGGALYRVEGIWAIGMAAMQGSGVLLTAVAVRVIDAWDLAGIRQAPVRQDLQVRGPYRLVRHPLYLGWLFAFWCIPTMTYTHLLFAVVTTVYILVAIQLEERDLISALGEDYRAYRARVPMILPLGRKVGPPKTPKYT